MSMESLYEAFEEEYTTSGWRESSTITEQRLCDQARIIRKNEWFITVEFEEISRRIESDSDNGKGDDS